ncbi:carbohydrate ABC transporter permease [Bifidobacterium eulemuris]|uniref:Sugar ABC transporter permease n=1 Tax=Bifidobacterium eulemuris TaxID=1765219 RepID=A0A261FXY9_9BIFI|nr:sugar ABC transporter permease [Bifidobacterium eulemuris]OZG64064.1 sugar ABC transporter permease [Bifidobacterium eulemuris]QOL32569.1 sugar ABC transporter permease [Bifidobacterium eulemuris]
MSLASSPDEPDGSRASFETRHRKALRRRNLTENLTSFEFLLPILVVFIVVVLIPFGQSVVFSFTDYSGYDFSTAKFVGLENYVTVFTDQTLLAGLGFTLFYTIATTVAITALALPLAVVLNRRFFGRNFVRSLFFFFSVPSMAVLGLVWQYIVSPVDSGAINQLLARFGIDAVPWLSDTNLARLCVIVIAVWAQVGWHATLYLAYLQAIPSDLYEQAAVDGANRRQQFLNITLPQMVPAMGVSIFMLLTGGLKVYDLPFTLTTGGPGHATYTVTQSIIVTGVNSGRYGLGSALGVIFFLCCALLVAIQQGVVRQIEKRLS